MVIDYVYNELRKSNKSLTMSEYSRDYLGTDRNYYAVMKNRNKDASGDVLIRLYGNIKKKAQVYEQLSREATLTNTEHYLQKSAEWQKIAELTLYRALAKNL